MERAGSTPASILIGAVVLLALLVLFLVIRLRKVHREVPKDEVTRTRLKRVFLCFLTMNIAGAICAGAMLIPVSQQSQEGWGMGAGMLLALTVWIALPVAAYNSLFLWRLRSVQVLWLLVVILFSIFAMFEDAIQNMGAILIVLVYFLSTMVLVVRGLTTLRQGPPA